MLYGTHRSQSGSGRCPRIDVLSNGNSNGKYDSNGVRSEGRGVGARPLYFVIVVVVHMYYYLRYMGNGNGGNGGR